MGSDSYGETAFLCVIIISIHAPLVGSDGCGICLQRCQLDFNPRSPCGERHTALNQKAIALCISIHAPLVGSDFYYFHCSFLLTISIHAPLVGSDRELVEWFPPGPPDFNPRSPCGERRTTRTSVRPTSNYFNPRSPCGERLFAPDIGLLLSIFQSTLPLWGATFPSNRGRPLCAFQSTLPLWGATEEGGGQE